MADFSTPFEAITSRLGSSAAWKKYFPGIATGTAPDYSEYKQLPSKTQLPSFKGIDFTTGKAVDLGQYANFGINSPGAEPSSNVLTPPTYSDPASPISETNLDRLYDKYRALAREQRADDYAYNLAMLDPLQKRVLDTAQKTREMDLAYGSQGLNIREQSPSAVAARAASAQNQLAQASAGFATELDAVSNAAYRAAMANAQGLAPRGRAA
jgi:hypothetical protein